MNWQIDMAHSHIGFSIRHMKICRVHGRFREGSGAVAFDPAALQGSKLHVEIATSSLDTGIEPRDKHLRSKDLFNTEVHPTMTFESRKVDGTFDDLNVVGELTLLGVTKEVALKGRLSGPITDPWGGERMGVTLAGQLNREDFGFSWNQPLASGDLMLDSQVDLTIDAQVVKK
jgi:polyisoprenoid-binding protein YceI